MGAPEGHAVTSSQLDRVRAACQSEFGAPAVLVRSPGRVNLIGEHTDYNEGFVLPAAVEMAIALAFRPRDDRRILIRSLDLDRRFDIDMPDLAPSPEGWPNYPLGVVDALRREGRDAGGFELVYGGDIPIGAGMSSSAALTCGVAFGLDALFGLGVERIAMARIAQSAEHNFAGVRCGLMDQMANLMGRRGQLLRLDCRDLSYRHVPFPDSARIYVCDTRVQRTLAASGYNERRGSCEAGVAKLRESAPEIASLRDVTMEMLEAHREQLDPIVYRRCRYVIEENLRVEAACGALARGDIQEFGASMKASHEGLARLYEVSCPELDLLVEAAAATPGVLGARMMGAGFGGCTINVIEAGEERAFLASMERAYARLGVEPAVWLCGIADGTERIS